MTEHLAKLIAQAVVLTFGTYGSSPVAWVTVHLLTPLVPLVVQEWRVRGVFRGEAFAKPISWDVFARSGLAVTLILPVVLFVGNLGRASYQAAQARTAQIQTLRKEVLDVERDRGGALSTVNTCEARLEATAAQIDRNQATTSQCLVELGRAQQESPFRLAVYSLPSSSRQETDRQSKQDVSLFERRFIVDANRAVSPVRLLVKCSERLSSADAYALGTTMPIYDAWTGPKPDGGYGVGISAPVWSAMSPMLVTIQSTDGDPRECGFSAL